MTQINVISEAEQQELRNRLNQYKRALTNKFQPEQEFRLAQKAVLAVHPRSVEQFLMDDVLVKINHIEIEQDLNKPGITMIPLPTLAPKPDAPEPTK